MIRNDEEEGAIFGEISTLFCIRLPLTLVTEDFEDEKYYHPISTTCIVGGRSLNKDQKPESYLLGLRGRRGKQNTSKFHNKLC